MLHEQGGRAVGGVEAGVGVLVQREARHVEVLQRHQRRQSAAITPQHVTSLPLTSHPTFELVSMRGAERDTHTLTQREREIDGEKERQRREEKRTSDSRCFT